MKYLHEFISEISKNAEIDRLELLYIDLTLILRRISKQQENMKIDSVQYIFNSGVQKGFIECLEQIETNIKTLSELKV